MLPWASRTGTCRTRKSITTRCISPQASHVPSGHGGDARDLVYCDALDRRARAGAGPVETKTAGATSQSSRSSALRVHHAQAVASHIKHVFLSGELFGERVEASWVLNSTLSQKLTCNKWTTFQERFMESWPEHVARHSYDAFWVENEPVFHAYDYGANIEIEVSEGLQTLGRETRLRPREDSDGEADADPGHDQRSAAAGSESQPQYMRGERQSVGGAQGKWLLDPNSSPDGLYSDGLTQLATELDQKYKLDHISSISYALAVDLNCLDSDDPEQKSAVCLPPSAPPAWIMPPTAASGVGNRACCP